MKDHQCNCDVCQYAHEVGDHLELISKEQRKFFEDLYFRYESIGLDLNVAECIIEGTWHTSDDYLIEARKRTGIPLPEIVL